MVTEEGKEKYLLKLTSLVIHGLARGLWELLGESANATAKTIGAANLTGVEKELGLEIAGDNPQDILAELNQIFVGTLGALEEADSEINGEEITLTYKGCKFMDLTRDLMDEGIPPFICPLKGMAAAAMTKKLGTIVRIIDSDVNTETKVCIHKLESM